MKSDPDSQESEINIDSEIVFESEIVFKIESGTLITIDNNGFHIHRENFPNYKADDFVREFLAILENMITVRFNPKAEFQDHIKLKHPEFLDYEG